VRWTSEDAVSEDVERWCPCPELDGGCDGPGMLSKPGSPSSEPSKIVLMSERWNSPFSSLRRNPACIVMLEEWSSDVGIWEGAGQEICDCVGASCMLVINDSRKFDQRWD